MAGESILPQHGRRGARRTLALVGAAAGAAALASVGLGYAVAVTLTRPKPRGQYDEFVMTPYETGADFEEVAFPPHAGEHQLRGWWFPRPETDRVVIGCHGYRGGKFELIGIATALWRAGFNVLLFDFHGHRPGHDAPATLGYATTEDFLGAVEYAKARMPGARIGVIGFSMGASVAIMGAARCPEVSCVVADTPFATHRDVVSHGVRRLLRLPGRPFVSIADYFLPRLAGYRGSDVRPVREVAAIAPRPLLLIHGTEDTISPVRHAYQIFAAAGEPKELWLAEGMGHCGAYFQNRAAYCARVSAFFARHLSGIERGSDVPARDDRQRDVV